MARGRELAQENALLVSGSSVLCCSFNSYMGSRSYSASARCRHGDLSSDEASLLANADILRVAFNSANNPVILVGDMDRDSNWWQGLLRLFEAFAVAHGAASQNK